MIPFEFLGPSSFSRLPLLSPPSQSTFHILYYAEVHSLPPPPPPQFGLEWTGLDCECKCEIRTLPPYRDNWLAPPVRPSVSWREPFKTMMIYPPVHGTFFSFFFLFCCFTSLLFSRKKMSWTMLSPVLRPVRKEKLEYLTAERRVKWSSCCSRRL